VLQIQTYLDRQHFTYADPNPDLHPRLADPDPDLHPRLADPDPDLDLSNSSVHGIPTGWNSV
jgi:hypothetical protein